ncbi:MAG: hypothetical protein ABI439_08505 [Rhodospirillales bacterium]
MNVLRRLLLVSGLACAFACQALPVAAQPPAPAGPPVTADVSGFRSARFGMTQDQVKEAIKADFDVDGKDVRSGANDQEKTTFLAVQFSNLVPDSGTALITYIFGFTSHKLIQVNMVWGKLAGQTTPPPELVSTGKLLQQYFMVQGFARDTIIFNRSTDAGGVVLFNGYDDKKRSVLLVLDTVAMSVNGAPSPTPPAAPSLRTKPDPKAPPKATAPKPGDKKPVQMQLVAASLRLSYIENAVSPDIFRIQRGKF